jgi:hypothetical protein
MNSSTKTKNDQRYTVMMSLPLRIALDRVAEDLGMSAASIVRQCLILHAEEVAPGFNITYEQAKRQCGRRESAQGEK